MNIIEYENMTAFHPGYYIKDIIDHMEISQDEFAIRLGITKKMLSELVSGKINLTDEVALLLSMMLGSDIKTWLDLQKTYEEKRLEIEKTKRLDAEIRLLKMLDYKYFEDLYLVPEIKNYSEKICELCQYFKISSLSVLLEKDFLVCYRPEKRVMEDKNLINARAWLQTAFNIGSDVETKPFEVKNIEKYIPKIREMTIMQPYTFIPLLTEIFMNCGIAFVLLPGLINSDVRGAVKWMKHNKVVLAMKSGRSYVDTFWFTLFHEIKHVLQQKMETTMVSGSKLEGLRDTLDLTLEEEADIYAWNILVPDNAYQEFVKWNDFSEESIHSFSKKIVIHAGIIVGRLQYDNFIGDEEYQNLKELYMIQ